MRVVTLCELVSTANRIRLFRAVGLTIALTFACSLFAVDSDAQTPAKPTTGMPAYRARILGVYDDATGEPLDSARVSDILNGNSSLTTRTGTVALYFLPDGGSLVRVQKLGYEPQTLTVAISPKDTTPLTVIMRRVTQLAPMVTRADSQRYISGALRRVQEREKLGFGYFIDDSVLRKNEGLPLSMVIASRLPGIQLKPGRASATYLMQSTRCTSGLPQVFVDGVPLSPEPTPDMVPNPVAQPAASPQGGKRTANPVATPAAGSAPPVSIDYVPFNLTTFDVSQFAAIEWYPDGLTLPIEFTTGRRCGALMLWTRER